MSELHLSTTFTSQFSGIISHWKQECIPVSHLGNLVALFWRRLTVLSELSEQTTLLNLPPDVTNHCLELCKNTLSEFSKFLAQCCTIRQWAAQLRNWNSIVACYNRITTMLESAFRSLPIQLPYSIVFNPNLDFMAMSIDLQSTISLLKSVQSRKQLKGQADSFVESSEQYLQSCFKARPVIFLNSNCGLVHLGRSNGRKLNSVFRPMRMAAALALFKKANQGHQPVGIIDTELGIAEHDHDANPTMDDPELMERFAEEYSQSAQEVPGFGTSYREMWDNGAMVCVKRLNADDFTFGVEGMLQASRILQLRSGVSAASLQPDSTAANACFINSVLVSCVHHEIAYCVSLLAPLGSMQEVFLTGERPDVDQLPASGKVSMLLDIACGLQYLHTHQLVHGRLKPSNILIFENFRVKLSDFGVQGLLAESTRKTRRGIDGIRWTAPEVVAREVNVEQRQDIWAKAVAALQCGNSGNKSEHTKNAATIASATTTLGYHFQDNQFTIGEPLGPAWPDLLLSPAVDVYAFGLLIVVLETKKKPFSNIELEEGVISAKLRGDQFHMPGMYPQKYLLRSVETWVHRCQAQLPGLRPSSDELVTGMEAFLEEVITKELEKVLADKTAKLQGVEKEIADLELKTKDVTLFISKGTELICKREKSQRTIYNPVEKKKEESAIQSAKLKLDAFISDKQALDEDMAGAQADKSVLEEQIAKLRQKLGGGRTTLFSDRVWSDRMDFQEHLLQIYTTEEERDFVRSSMKDPFALSKFVTKHERSEAESMLSAVKHIADSSAEIVDVDEDDDIGAHHSECSHELRPDIKYSVPSFPDFYVDKLVDFELNSQFTDTSVIDAIAASVHGSSVGFSLQSFASPSITINSEIASTNPAPCTSVNNPSTSRLASNSYDSDDAVDSDDDGDHFSIPNEPTVNGSRTSAMTKAGANSIPTAPTKEFVKAKPPKPSVVTPSSVVNNSFLQSMSHDVDSDDDENSTREPVTLAFPDAVKSTSSEPSSSNVEVSASMNKVPNTTVPHFHELTRKLALHAGKDVGGRHVTRFIEIVPTSPHDVDSDEDAAYIVALYRKKPSV